MTRGDDAEGFEPVFVDTVISDEEAPRNSTGLLAFVALIVVAIAALVTFGLAQSEGGEEPVADPTAEAEPTSTPGSWVEVALAETWSPASDNTFRLFSNGQSLCLRSSDGSIRETCAGFADGPVERVFFTALGGRPLLSSWCVAGAVEPQVQEVSLELVDGSRSRLRVTLPDAGGLRYFAGCRTDGVGLREVRYLDDVSTDSVALSRSGEFALVPSARALPPQFVDVGLFDGWSRAQVGGVEFFSNRPIEVPASSAGDSACEAPQFSVLSNAAADSVIVSLVELRGIGGLQRRNLGLSFEPAQVAAFFDCPVPDFEIVTARGADGGRSVEFAVAVGPDAPAEDVAVAEATIGLMRIVTRDDAPPQSSVTSPPVPTLSNPAVAWTGSEVVVWGGWSVYRTSVFDPQVSGVAPDETGRPEPLAVAISNGGAAWSPRTNTWRTLVAEPSPRLSSDAGRPPELDGGYSSLWIGSELLVWDRGMSAGRAFDPAADSWRELAPAPVSNGFGWEPDLVWTGTEVIAFGPTKFGRPNAPQGLGARYDPTTDIWRELPPPPRDESPSAVGVWTGTEALFLDGPAGGLAFEPVRDQWRTTAPLGDGAPGFVTDAFLIGDDVVAMNRDAVTPFQTGTLYVSRADSLESWFPEVFPPSPIGSSETAVKANGDLFVISSVIDAATFADGGWAAYLRSPDGDLSAVSLPEGWNRCGATPVVIPGRVFFWGGFDCDTGTETGDATVVDISGADSVG